jgi:hypothetical protein
MHPSSAPRLQLAGLVVALFVAAVVTHRIHASRPYSEPGVSVQSLFAAAAEGSLDRLRDASTPSFYAAFVEAFGDQKYRDVQSIFSDVQRLGLPLWREIRSRTEVAALAEYERLREEVAALGREEFGKQSIEQRLELIERRENDSFILGAGIRALPSERRRLIVDVTAFRDGRDREQFVDAYGWEFSSADDKKVLGLSAALSSGMTPEKLAFMDRTGLPLLPAAQRARLGSIKRDELSDPAAFKFKYGEPLAREYLARKDVPTGLVAQNCGFNRADSSGGMLRGVRSSCVFMASVGGRNSPLPVLIDLRKVDNQWLVDQMNPPMYTLRK